MCSSISFVLVLSLCSAVLADFDTVTIDTVNGPVTGIKSTTYQENKPSYAFLGIPYAQPPVGELRFKAPVPADTWTKIYNATYEKSICTQPPTDPNITHPLGSEDCLYLSVYTTKLPSSGGNDDLLPVLVWFHGGQYLVNSGNMGINGTDRFLNKDVIVVTLNYRLGIFGYLSTEDEACPGNYGLKDQLLALQWVQKSIKDFGGNPDEVTIIGESAGAAAVQYLLLSERAKGLFSKAIAESGNALNTWSQNYNARQNAFTIGALFNITTTSSDELIKELRTIDAYELLMGIISTLMQSMIYIGKGFLFSPVLEPASDEAVIDGYSYQKLHRGEFSQVPILQGFNSLEARLYTRDLPILFDVYSVNGTITTQLLVPDSMHINQSDFTPISDVIKTKYFGINDPDTNYQADLLTYLTDDDFVRPVLKATQLQSRFTPVYLYRFAFIGGVLHYPYFIEGAEHEEELQFLWLRSYTGLSAEQVTPDAILTEKRIIEMWTNFIKYGNPTEKQSENVDINWIPNTDEYSDLIYLNIDTDLSLQTDPDYAAMEFWDDLFDNYGNAPWNTY